MNRNESFHFFSVLQQFRKLDMSNLINGLSHSEFMILGMIYHKKPPHMRDCIAQKKDETEKEYEDNFESYNEKDITVSDLAARLFISSPAVSRMLGNLEDRGLIERYVQKSDRRNKYLRLTAYGKQVCTDNEKQIKRFFDEVVERMGEENMNQLSSLLNRMHQVTEDLMEEYKEKGRTHIC